MQKPSGCPSYGDAIIGCHVGFNSRPLSKLETVVKVFTHEQYIVNVLFIGYCRILLVYWPDILSCLQQHSCKYKSKDL